MFPLSQFTPSIIQNWNKDCVCLGSEGRYPTLLHTLKMAVTKMHVIAGNACACTYQKQNGRGRGPSYF